MERYEERFEKQNELNDEICDFWLILTLERQCSPACAVRHVEHIVDSFVMIYNCQMLAKDTKL